MNIITVNISDIKLNPDNPRIIKDENFKKLVRSIRDFPEMLRIRPIVVNDDMMVIGGKMRLMACHVLKLTEIPVIKASELTEEQQREFIIRDNAHYGEWDFERLANEWDTEELIEWGLELPVFETDNDYGTEFNLPSGDKEPFQQMTFTLADEQAEQIKKAISDIKQTEEYKYAETMGNENSNGNALYLIVMQWAEQRK